jgi:polysaccharide pyruvyl transferase WcaK-like protein
MSSKSVFLLNDTSITGHFGCIQVVETIHQNFAARGIKSAGSWPVAVDWRFASAVHTGLHKASAFIVNGEGTIHHTADRPRGRQLLDFARSMKRRSGKPVYLINASLEALEPGDFRMLRHFDGIFVRDRKSHAYLAENGVLSHWVPDLCLARPMESHARHEQVVCTDSCVKPMSRLLEGYSARIQASYAPMRPGRYRSYLRYILSDTAALVSSLQRYQQTIATAHSVITGRFHATLFCLLSATPFVAVASNTGKIEAVLEDVFGCTSRLVPAEAIAGLSRVHVPTFTAAEDSLRQTYLSAARTRIGRMFDVIAATV